MSAITTHVLDTARGEPAHGIEVTLERLGPDGRVTTVAAQRTDDDGRASGLSADAPLVTGRYRLVFATGAYFRARGINAFFPEVRIDFEVGDPAARYHVPLLLSPFGYTTYRGS